MVFMGGYLIINKMFSTMVESSHEPVLASTFGTECFANAVIGHYPLRACLKVVASAILADVEPVRLARRKQRLLAINLAKSGVSAR
jgi:hypothetical protein